LLARFDPPSVTEVVRLGDLRGGHYTERVTAAETEYEIEASFRHKRLGGEDALLARYSKPYPGTGLLTSDATDHAVEHGQQLRQKFAEWSMQKPGLAQQGNPSG
jgi:hypothetical protein